RHADAPVEGTGSENWKMKIGKWKFLSAYLRGFRCCRGIVRNDPLGDLHDVPDAARFGLHGDLRAVLDGDLVELRVALACRFSAPPASWRGGARVSLRGFRDGCSGNPSAQDASPGNRRCSQAKDLSSGLFPTPGGCQESRRKPSH